MNSGTFPVLGALTQPRSPSPFFPVADAIRYAPQRFHGRTLMPHLLKRVAARFPTSMQHELRRHYYAWQIRRGRFRTHEREFEMLAEFVGPGDWVADVGANVGHYTARLSGLVGPS